MMSKSMQRRLAVQRGHAPTAEEIHQDDLDELERIARENCRLRAALAEAKRDAEHYRREWRRACDDVFDVAQIARAAMTDGLAECERLRGEIAIDDQLLTTRKRLTDAIPERPAHGPECIPHAVEWVSDARSRLGDQCGADVTYNDVGEIERAPCVLRLGHGGDCVGAHGERNDDGTRLAKLERVAEAARQTLAARGGR